MSFVTFRRHYIDRALAGLPFAGDVIDVGGEKSGVRGEFRPPVQARWRFLNIDPVTQPDIVGSADRIPCGDAAFDWVKLTEVLEHLEHPEAALRECARVLRPGGRLVATVPFLCPVHGDPHDFQRWTPAGLRRLLAAAGFGGVSIEPMGGLLAVCADQFEFFCHLTYKQRGRLPFGMKFLRAFLRRILLGWLIRVDSRISFRETITTGYLVLAERRVSV